MKTKMSKNVKKLWLKCTYIISMNVNFNATKQKILYIQVTICVYIILRYKKWRRRKPKKNYFVLFDYKMIKTCSQK